MIGVIADDFTGATDVAAVFRREGLRTLLFFGVPGETAIVPASDAVVIALKTRMAAEHAAVSESLKALDWLRGQDPANVYFKYCSTFDSTARAI